MLGWGEGETEKSILSIKIIINLIFDCTQILYSLCRIIQYPTIKWLNYSGKKSNLLRSNTELFIQKNVPFLGWLIRYP